MLYKVHIIVLLLFVILENNLKGGRDICFEVTDGPS